MFEKRLYFLLAASIFQIRYSIIIIVQLLQLCKIICCSIIKITENHWHKDSSRQILSTCHEKQISTRAARVLDLPICRRKNQIKHNKNWSLAGQCGRHESLPLKVERRWRILKWIQSDMPMKLEERRGVASQECSSWARQSNGKHHTVYIQNMD